MHSIVLNISEMLKQQQQAISVLQPGTISHTTPPSVTVCYEDAESAQPHAQIQLCSKHLQQEQNAGRS